MYRINISIGIQLGVFAICGVVCYIFSELPYTELVNDEKAAVYCVGIYVGIWDDFVSIPAEGALVEAIDSFRPDNKSRELIDLVHQPLNSCLVFSQSCEIL